MPLLCKDGTPKGVLHPPDGGSKGSRPLMLVLVPGGSHGGGGRSPRGTRGLRGGLVGTRLRSCCSQHCRGRLVLLPVASSPLVGSCRLLRGGGVRAPVGSFHG